MAGGYDAVAWRVLKSLATYVAFDIYVAKDWACAMDPRRHPAIRRNQRSPNYARRRKKTGPLGRRESQKCQIFHYTR